MSFKAEIIVKSPGRINLIGGHTDYNGGFVLPTAIEKTIELSLSKNGTRTCTIKSGDYKSGFSVDLDSIEKSNFHWHNYILGVIAEIQKIKGEQLGGFDCVISSSLPMGSGISSSAALECGLAKGLNELFGLELSEMQLIELSRDAEHNFVGTKCGIMDQFAVVMGKKNQLIKLNCKTLEYEYVEADFNPYKIVLLNTNVSHNLSTSEYNTRREECQAALDMINQKSKTSYKYLCDVTSESVKKMEGFMPAKLYNRALYVTQENERVVKGVKELAKGDLSFLGKCLYESHHGLQHLYEVSCPELDFLVEFSKEYTDVIGSRMMGGGFGGCTINLVHKSGLKAYIEKVAKAYYKKFNIELTPIMVSTGDGVTITRQTN
ncbi:galactokinase [Flagellimonas nanhaiensis]|uniref:Galactokinase n=1 Tax=Flagellimonas nanhaiensis TaxID=2292706 RepID=A0A371JP66_9FLAO|nr:galactokinase [Allomuricauda nanhaiensis]RDY59297.1 galactokinase [Allomuricauda nanhaiensis]